MLRALLCYLKCASLGPELRALCIRIKLATLRPELRERSSQAGAAGACFVCYFCAEFLRNHSESDPTRAISTEGSSATLKICTARQRERSDTHDPHQRPPDPPLAKTEDRIKGCELRLRELGCVREAAQAA